MESDRQESLYHKLQLPRSVTIIGCGGVGTWVAINLAMAGTTNLVLIDHDVVSASNLNRLPFPPDSIGRPKVEVLREFIIRIRPNISVIAIADRAGMDMLRMLNVSSDEELLHVVYCCTDTLESQEEIAKYVKKIGGIYHRIGMDGFGLTFSMKPPPTWGESAGGYRIVPSWVGGAMIAGALSTVAGLWGKIYTTGVDINVNIDEIG